MSLMKCRMPGTSPNLRRCRFTTLSAALAAIVPLLWGCSRAPLTADRPRDGLLHRSDLQEVVDLQVDRDGPSLVEMLGDNDASVRARAAFALGSVQYEPAVPRLLALLDDRDERVRADAVFALGQTADSTAADELLSLLMEERSRTVRSNCLEALGKVGGASSLRQLTTLDLPSYMEPDRALAIGRYGIRRIHNRNAVELLVGYLTSDDPALRLNAAYYFGRITQTDAWSWLADRVRAALGGYGLEEEAAMYLIQGLGRLEDPADTDQLIYWLKRSQNWRVRANSARALSPKASDGAVRRALLLAINDPSIHVAVNCAGSLSSIVDFTAEELDRIESFIDLRSYNWQTAVVLLPVLARSGRVDFLFGWLERWSEEDPRAFSRGLDAVASLPGERAFAFLRGAALSDDSAIASAVVQTLSRLWRQQRRSGADPRPYFTVFSAALNSGDLGTTFAAASALSDSLFLPFGSVGLMVRAYRQMETPVDIEPMTAILGALGRAGDMAAVRLLRAELGNEHPVIRSAAASALTALTGEEVDLPDVENPPERVIDWDYLRKKGDRPRLEFLTREGPITVELYTDQAPLTVQTILQLAEEGLYDGVAFHRVVPNFVIQGGDFERQDGMGGPGFAIRSEFTRIPYERGVIGMASAGKDTEGSQFFITHSMQPHLDGRYTSFGRVVRGLDVVDSICEGDAVYSATILP